MAPPATKRRKLQHGNRSAHGKTSSADSADSSPSSSERQIEDESADSANEASDDFETSSDADSEVEEKPLHVATPKNRSATSRRDNEPSVHNRGDAQDGVYTAETFKSNLFKLQVDELLEQVKPKYGKKMVPAEDAMRALKTVVEKLPSRGPLSVEEAEKQLKSAGVNIPWPSPPPPKDTKYKFQYERPSSINATGSYPLKIATRTEGELSIDMVVTMPEHIFQEKDYLNRRYFYKRAFYLACLAAGIKQSEEAQFKLSFDCLNGNQLQPILVVRSSESGGGQPDFSSSKCRINILPIFPRDTFPEAKLALRANCLRPKGDEGNAASMALVPTPFYNSTLQSDAAVTSYLKLLHAASVKCDAFKDACILGRVWLKQRGFGSRIRKGGFGNFEWAVIMALLLLPNPGSGTPPLSPGYSSYQLFKATLQFLERHNLSKKPFTFQSQDVAFPKGSLAPVFFDGPRNMNILFKMTPWSYSRLQIEAKLTVDMLGDSLFDQFDSTFILKADLPKYSYDATLDLPLSVFEIDTANEYHDEKLLDTCHKIYKTLIRALTDRVKAISFSMPDSNAWPVGSRNEPFDQSQHLLVHFAIDPANAYRTIDHGPAADHKVEAASFRKFWGDKSELRRFKDGSILESVVWTTKDASTSILQEIVFYILEKQLGIQLADKAIFSSDSFVHIIPSGRIQGQSGVSAFTPIMNAFQAVEKDIRSLEDLPLQVRHIRAADAQLRYSSIEPASNIPASVVLQLEASTRWPDDLCAIQRTKAAFLLKLSEVLSKLRSGYTTRVGLENPSQPSQNQAYLDITARSGFTFRFRIYHDREATLLERQLKDKNLDAQSRDSAATALYLHNRDFMQVLTHTQAIQNLCTRFPALSPAIRLTKRWFASHLLVPHFAPELVELLVVRTFLQPHPWSVPSCASTGFLRTLAWISRWDWRHVPLIVDLSSTDTSTVGEFEALGRRRLNSDDIDKIQLRFEAWRRIDPAMNRVVLFSATNLDIDGNTWTDRGKPEKVVASRMTALAKAACAAIRADEDLQLAAMNGGTSLAKVDKFSPETVFTSQKQDYDIIIHISSKFGKKRKKKAEEVVFKNIEMQHPASSSQATESSLVKLFVEDLQETYGDAILWFYDLESLDCIAGLWNPMSTAQRAFKVKAGWNSIPTGKKENIDIQINKAAVCNEIKRLGGELVSSIDANR